MTIYTRVEGQEIRNRWVDRNERVREAGEVLILQAKSRLQVIAPYSASFRAGMVEIGARWRRQSGMWSVHESLRERVLELVVKCFGADKLRIRP